MTVTSTELTIGGNECKLALDDYEHGSWALRLYEKRFFPLPNRQVEYNLVHSLDEMTPMVRECIQSYIDSQQDVSESFDEAVEQMVEEFPEVER